MSNIIKLEYHGNRINQRDGDHYFNATQMAKANGKLYADFARSKSTEEFLGALSTSMGIPIDRLVVSVTTGPNDLRGTWIHPQVAINYGQWLNPEFAVWVSKIVMGHMQTLADEKNHSLSDLEQARIAREGRLQFQNALKIASMAGLRGNQALIAANRVAQKAVGFNVLEDMGINYLEAPEQEVLLTATDIGAKLGNWSGIKVNQFLQEHGFQVGAKDKKNRRYWEPTDKGIEAGGQMMDVERSNRTGQARQLRWASGIVEVLKGIIEEGAA